MCVCVCPGREWEAGCNRCLLCFRIKVMIHASSRETNEFINKDNVKLDLLMLELTYKFRKHQTQINCVCS